MGLCFFKHTQGFQSACYYVFCSCVNFTSGGCWHWWCMGIRDLNFQMCNWTDVTSVLKIFVLASYGQLHLPPSQPILVHCQQAPPLSLSSQAPWLIEFQYTGLIMVASLHCSVVFAWIAVLNRRRPVPLEQRAGHRAAFELCYSELVYHGSSCWTKASSSVFSSLVKLKAEAGFGKYFQ